MRPLERRYWWLLRAYPAGYRRERGEEMLGTLLENTPPDRHWPTVRETRALLMAGLRVRSGLNQPLTMAANLRLAALLGLAIMILRLAAADLSFLIHSWSHWHSAPPVLGAAVAYLVLTVAVVAAVFFGPPRFAAVLAVVTGGLWFWGDGSHGQGLLAAVVLVMMAILVRGQSRLPRLWLWLPASLLALQLLQALGYWEWLNLLGIPFTVVLWVILGGVVLWIAVDPRPALAIAIFIACVFVESVGPIVFGVQPQFPWLISVYAAGAVVVAAAAIWELRRHCVP
jgi:hypothetical protein